MPLEVGKPMQVGEVTLLALHPDAPFRRDEKEKQRIGNDLSLVSRIEYHNFSMLLTGDIGKQAEKYLLQNPGLLKANVLKGPHHGSRHSSTPAFIAAVQPDAVIFSSNYMNPWRHPHPEVVERHQNAGAQIWRTDLQGAIHIESDGFTHRIRGNRLN